MSACSRRLVLGMGAAGAILGACNARGETMKAPRRTLLSLNMRSSEMHPVEVPQLATFMMTVPLETAATALRIGLANTGPNPYRVESVACAQANEWIAAPQPGWVHFRFAGAAGVTVPGNRVNATGAGNVPAIIWSDWTDYRTQPASPRPQLVFRALLPPGTAMMAVPAGPGMLSWPTPSEPSRLKAQAFVAGDFVTNPAQPVPDGEPVPFTPVYVVQYRAATPGFQLVIGGDSHLAMNNTFAQWAATELSTPAAPISVWNTAWSGQPSNTFWPALDEAIDLAPPSITVIQGWTANDGMTPAGDEAYLNRVKESAARTIAAGGVPVIVKGLPRNLFGKPELTSWQRINSQLDTLLPGALVFDPLPYIEDPTRPGEWAPGMSNDAIHPNGKGNLTLRDPFAQLIAPLLS